MIDVDNLMRGQNYLELKESFVIFITTFDPFGYKMPVYTFKNICKENTNITLEDETSKIFFNVTAYKKESDVEIRCFMSYLFNKKPTDDFTRKIDRLVNELKYNENFKTRYTDMEAVWVTDAKMQGRLEGALQKAMESAKKFLSMGLSAEQVAEGTGLSIAEVQELTQKTYKAN